MAEHQSDQSSAYNSTFWQRVGTQTSIRWERTKIWLRLPENRKKLFKWGVVAAGTGFLFVCLLAVLVYVGAFGKLPTYTDLKAIQNYTASQVYAEDKVQLGKYYVQNRINAGMEEISPNVLNALVATEDARFFEHRGIDLRAWVRVLVKSVLLMDDSAGGGSTLSQQLAKNLYPRTRYWVLSTFINKVKETYVARRLERTYSKDELLNLYLNTVPFGEDIYGIKVASQRFFNIAPKQLRVEQAAVLVGMLKGNTLYNPVRHPKNALKRRNVVMAQMVKYKHISKADYDKLQKLPLGIKYNKEGHNEGLATYFREHLRLEVEDILQDYTKPDGSPYNLYTDGLRIYTTINSRMQRYAEEAVQEHMGKLQKDFYDNWKNRKAPWNNEKILLAAKKRSPRYLALQEQGVATAEIDKIFATPIRMRVFDWKEGEVERTMSPLDSLRYYLGILQTGFLAMEPQTGLIKAWVGGNDYQFFQYDHVKSRRQVGSTFKPIVYAAALENGMFPCEYTENQEVTYSEYKNWKPRNAGGAYGGVYSMEGALSESVNAVSVAIILRAGVSPVRKLAKNMGLEGSIPNEPSIALGTADASLYEMVNAYGTFANRGRRPTPHYLDRIETADGKLIVKFDRPNPNRFPQMLTTTHADMMIKMLQSVINSGTGRRLRYEFGLGNEIGGKTGTTQNNSDGWFVGFTPKLVAGAWVGAETPQVHFRSTSIGQGGYSALPIWGRFMRKVNADSQLKSWRWGKFPTPADSVTALMQCPHFLPEMPMYVDELGLPDTPGFFGRLLYNFKDNEDGTPREVNGEEVRSRRPSESNQEYLKRIEREVEKDDKKDDRREKRKKFWNKLLFDKEDEQSDNQKQN